MAAVCEEKLAEIFSFKIQGENLSAEPICWSSAISLIEQLYLTVQIGNMQDIAGPKFLIKFFSLLDHQLLALFQIYSSIQAQPATSIERD